MYTAVEKHYVNACLVGDIDTVGHMIKNENKSMKNIVILTACVENACKGGHYDIFKLLTNYKDVDNYDNKERDFFRYACKGGNSDIINYIESAYCNEALLDGYYDSKYKIYQLWNHGLMGACDGGNFNIFKLCIDKMHSKLKVKCSIYYNLLSTACKSGNIVLVQFIIDKVAGCKKHIYGQNITNKNSDCSCDVTWTSKLDWDCYLLNACTSGNMDLVHLLINYGASNWNMCLYEACLCNNMILAEFMIEKGANTNMGTGIAVGDLNKCLHQTCRTGNMQISELLIKHGANDWDLAIQGTYHGGHFDLMELIIKARNNEENYDENYKENYTESHWDMCMFEACRGGNLDAAKLAIERGSTDICGSIRIAGYNEHIEIVEFIMYLPSAWLDVFDIGLEYACLYGNLELAKVAIEKGATCWSLGLINACFMGYYDLVKLMLQHGTDSFSTSFINECLQGDLRNNTDISKLLITAGADNLHPLSNTEDLRLYCLHCKFIKCKQDSYMYDTLLQKHPPYVLFLWSKGRGSGSGGSGNGGSDGNGDGSRGGVSKLPVELFRLLFELF